MSKVRAWFNLFLNMPVKPVYSSHSKKHKIVFQDQLSLKAGQKYRRMLRGGGGGVRHSAIRSTFIKLPFLICFVYF